jgi:predicted dienelactone hydrolase
MNVLIASLLLALTASTVPSQAPAPAVQARAYENPGPFAVATVLYDWTDSSRSRPVPVKVYYPKTGKGPFPVIVFSHGLGGSRENYEYIGRHWASHGYVSVHVQHLGSDDAVWRGSANPARDMARAAADPHNALARPLDVTFVLNQIEKLNRTASPFKGRLNLKAMGMAGHSFGAWTTLAVAGQVFGRARELSLADPRVKAGIDMSPPVPGNGQDLDRAYGGIKIPILHMTGTLDDSPIGDTQAGERRIPFDHIRGVDQYLVTFEGGDHMIFSGRARREPQPKDELFQELIRAGSVAFWDAYLKGDARAKDWLMRGGYAAALGEDGRLEQKH